jgi:pyruvate,orthophosphate dikinase
VAVFDIQRARQLATAHPVILIRNDLDAADLAGLAVAAGILTRAGGRTSHAAVVARELEKVCLVACGELRIDANLGGCTIGATRVLEGTELTLDGQNGLVYAGPIPMVTERPDDDLALLEGRQGASNRGDPAPELRQDAPTGR